MARSGCIYGPTGTYKTTAIAHMARYIADRTGKSTLLFSADGGGWDSCEELVKVGMVMPYRCEANVIPLPIIRRVSQGYWPENPLEPQVDKVNFRMVNWDKVGAIGVEGITSLGTMLMRHCADKNLKAGEEGTSKIVTNIRVDDQVINETFAQNSRGHYGFVQNQLYSLVMNFISLPVEYVLFTGHEQKYAEDGDLQCGIKAPGKAITPLIPTWVGDCIHAQDYQETLADKTVKLSCRYYFRKHVDPSSGAIFDAKPRVTHSKALEIDKIFPGGYFTPTPEHGFDLYLEALDKLAKDASEDNSLKDWRAKADAKLGRTPKPVAASAK